MWLWYNKEYSIPPKVSYDVCYTLTAGTSIILLRDVLQIQTYPTQHVGREDYYANGYPLKIVINNHSVLE